MDDNYAKIRSLKNSIIILEASQNSGFQQQRRFFIELMNQGINNPVIIKRSYDGRVMVLNNEVV